MLTQPKLDNKFKVLPRRGEVYVTSVKTVSWLRQGSYFRAIEVCYISECVCDVLRWCRTCQLMIEIKWNHFRAKFEGYEDEAFERLCYLLFLRENSIPEKGLFGYYNQIGIETEPALIDGYPTGFQAKYSDSQIDVSAIKDSLTKAKGKHNDLKKVVVYSNREFTQTRKTTNPPEGQVAVETHAAALGLTIEWRVKSNFVSLLSTVPNQDLAEHFFCLDPGRYEFIGELKRHTQEILGPIRTSIDFSGRLIQLDRSAALSGLDSYVPGQITVVHGPGGVGKTALLRALFDSLGETVPLLVFKASEFNLRHINDLFLPYGGRSLEYFTDAFASAAKKFVVIDSAERLSEIDDHGPFREFLTCLTEAGWTVVLTTRDIFLDTLSFQLLRIYGCAFEKLRLDAMTAQGLEAVAEANGFSLPASASLRDLIRNPFYLAEYLQLVPGDGAGLSADDFQETLWRKKIRGTHSKDSIDRRREEAFLATARHRADTGGFSMPLADADVAALRALELDEVLGFDQASRGYFITHDIYEEWALEKIIEQNFASRSMTVQFFGAVGSSLPMRRAFRHWLSKSLRDRRDTVRSFVEESIQDPHVSPHWRDETMISVLLSDYSDGFFDMFERLLLADDCELLVRVIFLLRTGCKEPDLALTKTIGTAIKDASTEMLFTAPVGTGWMSAITFVHKHIGAIPPRRVPIVISLLEDWVFSKKIGPTTRLAGSTALHYYNELVDQDRYADDKMIERLVGLIFGSATEVRPELDAILDGVIAAGSIKYRQRHSQLIKALCSDLIGYNAASCTPAKTMKVAELYWLQPPGEERDYNHGVEAYFNLRFGIGTEYFPASSFQTPMLALLRSAPMDAFAFLHSFNDKTIGFYIATDLDHHHEQLELDVDGKKVSQHVNSRIWHIYRGTQVAPALLDSMHMALERFLLEVAESQPDLILPICRRLLSESKYASVTGAIVSVVLAYPDKLFDIAKILLGSPRVVYYDLERTMHDQSAKRLYTIPSKGFGFDLHINERLETCDQEHRSWSFEDLIRNFQFFDYAGNEEVTRQRQEDIWAVLDRHYAELPTQKEQDDDDKAWRMSLARMDRRRMSPAVEPEEGGDRMIISFNPAIEPDLQTYREEGASQIEEFMRLAPLKVWAIERFERRAYESPYNDEPASALQAAKEILTSSAEMADGNGGERFWLMHSSTPVYVCAVLLRDYADILAADDIDFCSRVLLDVALIPQIGDGYLYQITDGIDPAISSLAIIFDRSPKDREEAKELLLLSLLHHTNEVSTFAKRSVIYHGMWDSHPKEASSLLFGFLALKPAYDELSKQFWRGRYSFDASDSPADPLPPLAQQFAEKYETEIVAVMKDDLAAEELGDLASLPIAITASAIELIPLGSNDVTLQPLISTVGSTLADPDGFAEADRDSGFTLKYRTVQKFANLVVSARPKEAVELVQPFIDRFDPGVAADLFKQLAFAEDDLKKYESFWSVWEAFYPEVVSYSKRVVRFDYPDQAIRNYLLGGDLWKDSARSWPSLREREKIFFKKASRDLGQHPSAFYAINRFLNEIGSPFLSEGIVWISDLLKARKTRASESPETNTVHYLETLARRYAEIERRSIRSSPEVRDRILVILDYLVGKGSVNAFLLRDQLA